MPSLCGTIGQLQISPNSSPPIRSRVITPGGRPKLACDKPGWVQGDPSYTTGSKVRWRRATALGAPQGKMCSSRILTVSGTWYAFHLHQSRPDNVPSWNGLIPATLRAVIASQVSFRAYRNLSSFGVVGGTKTRSRGALGTARRPSSAGNSAFIVERAIAV